jgi:K+-transporting ATPase ATPase C chain
MFREMRNQIRPTLMALAAFSVLLGLVYPAAVTGIAHVVFPTQAQGSILQRAGRPAGSALIGQPFADPSYFWGRPSATAPFPYNAAASSGSNLGPTNPALKQAVSARIAQLRAADPSRTADLGRVADPNRTADPGEAAPIPVDLVTSSGSGLDPDISPAAAEFQVGRVARARKVDEAAVRALVARFVEQRQLGVLGEARVNVLKLNLALDDELKRGPADGRGASQP